MVHLPSVSESRQQNYYTKPVIFCKLCKLKTEYPHSAELSKKIVRLFCFERRFIMNGIINHSQNSYIDQILKFSNIFYFLKRYRIGISWYDNKKAIPKLQTYNLSNSNTKQEYLEEILQCSFKYILSYSSQDTLKTKSLCSHNMQPEFTPIDNKECIELSSSNNLFGICFYNEIEDSILNIDRMVSADNEFRDISDETMLSALKCASSVCILCDINNTPKSFSGSFRQREISYEIEKSKTGIVTPKFKVKKT